ncbi:dimethylarginine dimethylaminohydrolase family protein [Rhizorhabdus dicambivorans]|uniref:arginine deiminase n=1 Tax=Rhizorhabdus dicambivorans TaxID=1850238 RepID=A0A2A4G015_9SPHN|nr:arginine deiminase family protein [Rhizorhabdus dicambivorans]ATE65124.1 hypothetical protein CMV14_12485 [Rhizorhabdus dicambivorans]PCE44397.1 hypothetical protein COO09_01870 [Rhizorhabdus dicambivorans]
MKLDFLGLGARPLAPTRRFAVTSETDRLTDVMLCRPSYLAPVPCCAVTRQSLADGFTLSVDRATAQHRALQAALERHNVRCHLLPPDPALPDMCFTRDALLTSPWGLIKLRPATPHRREEADRAFDFARGLGAPPAAYVRQGRIEGGDIAIVRSGLVVIGWSGERTDWTGAEALAEIFRGQRWDVITYAFDPELLHLDTQFCMVDEGVALACIELLDPAFVRQIEEQGIELIAVEPAESRRLGCNILSLGQRRIISSAANDRINGVLRGRGFDVEAVDIDQFTRCGGGIHCLTMPLARAM